MSGLWTLIKTGFAPLPKPHWIEWRHRGRTSWLLYQSFDSLEDAQRFWNNAGLADSVFEFRIRKA